MEADMEGESENVDLDARQSWNNKHEDNNLVKPSKRALNLNAIKFKLNRLYSTTIRYEVIYKNLVRDIRKFFSKDFNDMTDFIKKKRKNTSGFFIDCLRSYIHERMG